MSVGLGSEEWGKVLDKVGRGGTSEVRGWRGISFKILRKKCVTTLIWTPL